MPYYIPERIPEPPQESTAWAAAWRGPEAVEHSNARNEEIAQEFGKCAITYSGRYIDAVPETTSTIDPNNGFELTVTDELLSYIQPRSETIAIDFKQLTEQILADPFGETCIDAFKDTYEGQWARLVHKVDGPLANLVPGKKLALKGTGLEMDKVREYLDPGSIPRINLKDQFRKTLALQRAQAEHAPSGIHDLVSVNEVYGVIAWTDKSGRQQEWMLMEYVENAEPVKMVRLAKSSGGLALGFYAENYPDLAEIAMQPYRWYPPRPTIDFKDLATELGKEINLPIYDHSLSDLSGNNLLRQDTPSGPRYTIIDVQ